ncbi:MAG TPA: DUF2069 domain-containing protein [Paenalcaligenes hominis]|uniref:DUF2069 domain-containing protein n=1 Tax=Paenalcaligenes hominis TaxID=643674 RepID=A0A1U9JY87_9BURK|nr:DUF2069 domain-containing protein [Paenalcaligenes hominis]AQS50689.1 hypothetical protein PAEH1_02450 [Paenalcaligenes hominis]NJB64388.1 putative membrane protein [Paenalcaligenes hominis]GGE68044.1 membrane protein [Paenalcaligenes hominis]HJH24791.1 DUF2069 domain-containing protein [Paenalcaligenes hominis]
MNVQLNPILYRLAALSLVGLIILCLAWELFIAPIRPGGSYLALKVLPLLLPLRGVLKGNVYTLQWSSMLMLLYFMEGVTRAWSDPNPLSVKMACIEIVLSLIFYVCAMFYLWPAKKAAKQNKKVQSLR